MRSEVFLDFLVNMITVYFSGRIKFNMAYDEQGLYSKIYLALPYFCSSFCYALLLLSRYY